MNEYMICITLPDTFTEEFISLIPEQRTYINNLMHKGIVTGYSLALDRSRLWVTMLRQSEVEVEQTLITFPLYKFFRYEIYELAFCNEPILSLPLVSMN